MFFLLECFCVLPFYIRLHFVQFLRSQLGRAVFCFIDQSALCSQKWQIINIPNQSLNDNHFHQTCSKLYFFGPCNIFIAISVSSVKFTFQEFRAQSYRTYAIMPPFSHLSPKPVLLQFEFNFETLQYERRKLEGRMFFVQVLC